MSSVTPSRQVGPRRRSTEAVLGADGRTGSRPASARPGAAAAAPPRCKPASRSQSATRAGRPAVPIRPTSAGCRPHSPTDAFHRRGAQRPAPRPAAGPGGTVASTPGTASSGMWISDHHASTPARDSSASSRLVIEPTSNRAPGCSRRAISIIAGDRSMPNASAAPSSRSSAAACPGPQPTSSATGPPPIARTSSGTNSTTPARTWSSRSSRSRVSSA